MFLLGFLYIGLQSKKVLVRIMLKFRVNFHEVFFTKLLIIHLQLLKIDETSCIERGYGVMPKEIRMLVFVT